LEPNTGNPLHGPETAEFDARDQVNQRRLAQRFIVRGLTLGAVKG
jgi:hypothetical protein